GGALEPGGPYAADITARSGRWRLSARVDEGLVHNFPRAVDPVQRHEVDERDLAPVSVLGHHRAGRIADLVDRQHPTPVVAGVARLVDSSVDELGDRHVVAPPGDIAEHASVLVETLLQQGCVTLGSTFRIQAQDSNDLVV